MSLIGTTRTSTRCCDEWAGAVQIAGGAIFLRCDVDGMQKKFQKVLAPRGREESEREREREREREL